MAKIEIEVPSQTEIAKELGKELNDEQYSKLIANLDYEFKGNLWSEIEYQIDD